MESVANEWLNRKSKLPSSGTSPLALVKLSVIAFFLQADKKIVPAMSGTRKVLIRIGGVVKGLPVLILAGRVGYE